MPFSDINYCQYHDRCRQRSRLHGNWRQHYVNESGICTFELDDGTLCGETNSLEFHSPFGEHNGNGFKYRVLRCVDHHYINEHGQLYPTQSNASKLTSDIQNEIFIAGSFSSWLNNFGLSQPPLSLVHVI